MYHIRKRQKALHNKVFSLSIDAVWLRLGVFILVVGASSAGVSDTESVETTARKAFTMVTPRIYPKDIVINKLRLQFDPLGKTLQLPIFYRPVSRKEELAEKLIGNEIDLIIWGYIPELHKRVKQAGFSLLLTAKLEVDLYGKANSSYRVGQEGITIGGLDYTAATKIAIAHYKKMGMAINVKTYTNYFEAIKELNAGYIDYIVAPPTFFREMKADIKQRYRLLHSIPTDRKIHIYLRRGNLPAGEAKTVAEYFINNIEDYGQFSAAK